jgi:hypothetical protein
MHRVLSCDIRFGVDCSASAIYHIYLHNSLLQMTDYKFDGIHTLAIMKRESLKDNS